MHKHIGCSALSTVKDLHTSLGENPMGVQVQNRPCSRTMRSSSPSSSTLHQRRRGPTPHELDGIPWLRLLQPAERERAVADLQVVEVETGELICTMGRAVTYWMGLIEGLLKMSADNAQGLTMTFTGVPPGGWFGEGTALKREPYRYNIQALRKSVVAGLPVDTFHWLLDHSIGFNRFVMNQLNERLGQFIAAREIDRLNNPEVRVARSLAALFNPVLYPGVGLVLRITQQELAYLVGLSRQRVNEALAALEAEGVIQVEYGGLRVLDLTALRNRVFEPGRQVLKPRTEQVHKGQVSAGESAVARQ
jgi:CRP-like cAMP-binding protein